MPSEFYTRGDSDAGDVLVMGEPVVPVRRSGPVFVRRQPFGAMLGRDIEIAAMRGFLADASKPLIGIAGAPGSGKSELLTRLAFDADGILPDGVILARTRGRVAADILAAVYDALFEPAEPRRRPAGPALTQHLRDVRLVLLLDDLDPYRELPTLWRALPRSKFVFTTRQRADIDDISWLGLGELPEDEAIALLQRAHQPFVIPHPTAQSIVRALGGNAGRIVQVPASGLSPSELASTIDSQAAFDRHRRMQIGATLSPEHVIMLAAVAHVGEFALGGRPPAALLSKMGFLSYASAGWEVATGLEGAAAREGGTGDDVIGAIGSILNQPERLLNLPRDVIEEAGNGVADILMRGEFHGRLATLKPLATALATNGSWATWGTFVRAIATAASSANETSTQAWALHEIGTHAAAAGDRRSARGALTRALDLREGLSDAAGITVTQRNLRTMAEHESAAAVAPPNVPPPPPPPVVLVENEPPKRPKPLFLQPLTIAAMAVTAVLGFTLARWLGGGFAPAPQAAAQQAAIAAHHAPAAAPVAVATLPPAKPATAVALAATPKSTAVPTARPTAKPTAPPTPRPTTAPAATVAPAEPTSAPKAKPHATPTARAQRAPARAAMPTIERFDATPRTIAAGDISTVCARVSRATKVLVYPIGKLDPTITTCREIRPKATATLWLTAINAAGRGVKRPLVVTVVPRLAE